MPQTFFHYIPIIRQNINRFNPFDSVPLTTLHFETSCRRHSFIFSYHMLDPVFSPSTELAGFRMVIVFTIPSHLVRSHASSFPSPFFFISFSTCVFPRMFRSSSSSTTTHFKFQSLHYHIFIFFPQNMTVPPYTACFSHPI